MKKGAIELSIGTIVVVVLAMAMLILGLILVQNIFEGTNDVTDITIDQLKDQVVGLFGDDKRLVMLPQSRQIEVKQGEPSAFGIGIKNLNTGANDGTFSYEVIVSDPDIAGKCGVSEAVALSWISTGKSESSIPLAPGDFTAAKVLLSIPEGSALCNFRYRVNVDYNSQPYASDVMDIIISS